VSKIRVAVLMGGTSAERDISLSTGRQIMAALDPDRYIASALDAAALSGGRTTALPTSATPPKIDAPQSAHPTTDLVPMDLGAITRSQPEGRPDVVFIALHGQGGEDGTIQGLLELLGIPYTGSGVLASALAMDKMMAKRVMAAAGVPVPDEIVVRGRKRTPIERIDAEIRGSFGYPVIVKPNSQGSTIGCTIIREADRVDSRLSPLDSAIETALACDTVALIEPLLSGVEITVGLLGNEEPEVLPIIEIEAKGGFYDYEAKYATGGSSHIIPARISETAARSAHDYAVMSHVALGCRGMSRVDMMVVGDEPFVLEVNTIPGMTPTSLLPDAAKAAGISFSELLDRIIVSAVQDCP
jgi:D-alanine-D-alanine ligase